MNIKDSADISRYIDTVRVYNGSFSSPRGVYIETLGCQQNEADSERLYGYAEKMGYTRVSSPDVAALILVNTCAIREHAEKRALSLIGQMKHRKETDKPTLIGVTGCMSAEEHRVDELRRRYPYVDFTLAPSELHRLPEAIARRIGGEKRQFLAAVEKPPVVEGIPVSRTHAHRAYVSIMYGCNNFCSYCIVPYVRGRERSRDKDEVIAEVKDLVARGYKDITLLGQNVNSYAKGKDYDFADLLSELDKIEGEYVLRFMTSHPKDASYKLIDVMASSKHIAHQFHLPLQSGSDSILKAMNRHYDKARYLDIVRYIREKMPDAALSSDIIVGFPGETDADFEDTMDILRTVRFDMLFSFIYSPRKGTPAAEKEQIDPKIKGERFDRLLALQHDIALEKNQPMVGKTIRVLCDGPSKNNPEIYSGREEGNKIVFFTATPEQAGKFVNVKIDRADAFALWGEIVN